MPDCELPRSDSPNLCVQEIYTAEAIDDSGDADDDVEMGLVALRDIQPGEFYTLGFSDEEDEGEDVHSESDSQEERSPKRIKCDTTD